MFVRYDELRVGDLITFGLMRYIVSDIIVGNLQENDSAKWVYQIFYTYRNGDPCDWYSVGPANKTMEKIQIINLT